MYDKSVIFGPTLLSEMLEAIGVFGQYSQAAFFLTTSSNHAGAQYSNGPGQEKESGPVNGHAGSGSA